MTILIPDWEWNDDKFCLCKYNSAMNILAVVLYHYLLILQFFIVKDLYANQILFMCV